MNIYILLAILVAFAIAINIPLGYLRQGTQKFTFAWFFYVHFSIPLIIFLRIKEGVNWKFIPFSLSGAVLGQIIGGRIKRKRIKDD
ncbi:MAG: hypothetical protein FWD70_01065 [Desulfuromonadales bacterium]|nr:hypothetical protein [Desulfuromonadales bacterium]